MQAKLYYRLKIDGKWTWRPARVRVYKKTDVGRTPWFQGHDEIWIVRPKDHES